jgi:hypothetical protein
MAGVHGEVAVVTPRFDDEVAEPTDGRIDPAELESIPNERNGLAFFNGKVLNWIDHASSVFVWYQ